MTSRPRPRRANYSITLPRILGKNGAGLEPHKLPKSARGRVLATVEGFALAAAAGNAIVHRLEGYDDPDSAWCAVCSRRGSLPMRPAEARSVRELMRRSGLRDDQAFAFARSRIIVSETNRFRVCPCDLASWNRAIRIYNDIGPKGAWKTIGVK